MRRSRARHPGPLTAADIAAVAERLDEAGFLDSPRFAARRDRIEAEFAARPARRGRARRRRVRGGAGGAARPDRRGSFAHADGPGSRGRFGHLIGRSSQGATRGDFAALRGRLRGACSRRILIFTEAGRRTRGRTGRCSSARDADLLRDPGHLPRGHGGSVRGDPQALRDAAGSRRGGSATSSRRSAGATAASLLDIGGRAPHRALHRVPGGDAALGARRPPSVHGGARAGLLSPRGGVGRRRAGGRRARAALPRRARRDDRGVGSAASA